MADLSGKESKEVSLQTHGLGDLVSIGIECFYALNSSAFLIAICGVIVRWFPVLNGWLCVVICLAIGSYIVSLIYRRRRIGWLYGFLCGFGSAIAMRHVL